MSDSNNRTLFRIQAVLSALTGGLGVLTIFWKEWIEALTGGWDPDKGNGSAEALIVLALAAISIALGLAARRTWRRTQTA